ncbi:diguanylate cyclase [Chloroflexota bacterium]
MSAYTLVSLLSFASYSALIVLVLRHKPRRLVHNTFAMFLFGAALWAGFALSYYLFPESHVPLSKLRLISALYTVVAFYHFLRVCMNKPGGIGMIAGYAAVAGLIPAIALDKTAGFISRIMSAGSNPEFEFALVYVGAVILGAVILISKAIAGLIQTYRHSTDPLLRNSAKYLLVGAALMAVCGLINMHPLLTKYPLANFGNLANAVIITFAIARYQLLDISLILRRGIVYAFTGIGAIGLYLVILSGYLPPLNLQASYATLIIGAGAALLITILFHPTRRLLQKWLERLIFEETYDYRHLLLNFANKMSHVLDLDELAEYMLTLITKGLHAKEAYLFLADNSETDYFPRYIMPSDANDSGGIRLAKDSPIVTWLAKENRPLHREQLDIIPQMKSLWQRERDELDNSQIELLFPIKNKGVLIGVLAIGKRRHSDHYGSEDLDLVMALTNQAGVMVENAQLYAAARMRANTDDLTGLYNHRYFHESLEEEISRGLRFGSTFTLVLLDLDLFKGYNDTHGHLAGDEVLRQVGQAIKGSLRNTDMAFRYGGDEFALILASTSPDNAHKVSERVRSNIEEGMSSKELPITCSLGVSSWPADGLMKDALIQSADSTLYHAKRWGNRTCLASELIPPNVTPSEASSSAKQGMLSTIYALAATVDARDHHTYGHSRQVSNYAAALGEALGLTPEKLSILHTTALLHDIGKIGISDEVLNKSEHLSEQDLKPVYSHPTLGVSILRHIDGLAACLPGIQYHHERYDGTGYPTGLKGNNIPLDARIVSIADAFEAMTSPRPYRQRTLSYQEALDELGRHKNTQFDGELVDIFANLMRQLTPPELEAAPR